MPRKRLNSERESITHSFKIGEYKGHMIVGLYQDGSPGEIFLRMAHLPQSLHLPDPPESLLENEEFKAYYGELLKYMGSIQEKMQDLHGFMRGIMDQFATVVSVSLQHGVSLRSLCNKFKHTRFKPDGFTQNAAIRITTSIPDYVFRWLNNKFLENKNEEKK